MIIREAKPDDADQIIAYVPRLDAEPDSMIPRALGEFQITAEQEQVLLASYLERENSAYFVAESADRLIGILICEGGTRLATRHNASLGMSVAREERNNGIGTALLGHLIAWAQDADILNRLELEVYAHSAPAIHLYRKFGFVEEGKRLNAYFQHGRFIDGIFMARQL